MTKINEQDTQPSLIHPDAANVEKPVVLKGDFAAGERTMPAAPVVENFASSEQTVAAATAVGDFASGEHTPPPAPPPAASA